MLILKGKHTILLISIYFLSCVCFKKDLRFVNLLPQPFAHCLQLDRPVQLSYESCLGKGISEQSKNVKKALKKQDKNSTVDRLEAITFSQITDHAGGKTESQHCHNVGY